VIPRAAANPGARSQLEARVLFSRGEGDSAGRAAVETAASQAASAPVLELRRIGVEGPTLTQDAREALSARVAAQSANARARPR
jgi:hypothetical protein